MAYIDRQKAIAYVEEQYRLFDNDESKQAIVEGCVEALKFTPTADVAEVKHGSWTFARSGRKVVCSCCEMPAPFDKKVGYHTLWSSPYCPNCGAKMDGKDTNVSTK